MKIKKIVMIIVSVLMLVLILTSNVYASSINTNGVKVDNKLANQFDDMGSIIISTIRIIGMIVSVGALMIMGIRYMVSSVEEKALQKESMIFYCIGAVLLFAIVNIVSAIYEMISNI